MPEFEIVGASRETGKPVRITINATTTDQAESEASTMGVVISTMRVVAEPVVPAHAAPAAVVPASRPVVPVNAAGVKNFGICPNPNCGYVGAMNRKARGSWAIAIVLLLLWVLPGLIYLMIYSGFDLVCPNCKMKVGSTGPTVS